MAKSASYHVQFRRRRSGKTNYHRRKRLLRSEKQRLVVRRSNKHQRVSIVEAKIVGDSTLVDASSQHLKEYSWKAPTSNVPAAYLTGYLAGKYAKTIGIHEAILDIGVNTCRKDTRISAMLLGIINAGLKIPHNPDVFPSEERYTGKIIADYAAKLKKENSAAYDKQFSFYTKNSLKPENLPTYFNSTKKAIDSEFTAGTMKNKLKNRNKKNIASKEKNKTKTTTIKKPSPVKKPTTTTEKPTTTVTKKPTSTKTTSKKTTSAVKSTSTTKTPTKQPAKSTSTTIKPPSTTTKKSTTTTVKKSPSIKKPTTSTTKKTTDSKTKKTPSESTKKEPSATKKSTSSNTKK